MIVSILLTALMLFAAAFFTGMEIAFTEKNRLMLDLDRKQSRLFDRIAGYFVRRPDLYRATILTGRSIAATGAVVGLSILIHWLAVQVGWCAPWQKGLTWGDAWGAVALFLLIAGMLPIVLFGANPNRCYRIFAPFIYLLSLLLYPVSRLGLLFAQGILRLAGRKPADPQADAPYDRAELEELIEAGGSEAAAHHEPESTEIKLFQNALDFAGRRVRDCMVPRVDIEAVELHTPIAVLSQRFVETMYSRIFVWEGSIDNIVGYVNSKCLFTHPASIQEVLRSVNFVPETMPLQTVLQNFIKHRSNIAVVIDEFGGTAGIISLEDVLEQIFGEIEDEHDLPDLTEECVGEGEYLFSCRLEVKYLNEKYDLGIEESREYDTLAGFIIYRYEGLPAAGEVLTTDGLEIEILRTTRSRIELARVRKV